MGELQQRKAIRKACWAATGIGLALGPGIDAGPLIAIWAVGYVAMLRDAKISVDEAAVRKAIGATLFVGGAQWVVSGLVAKVAIGAAAAAALTVTTGVGAVLAPIAVLGTNALINALYTFRFLSTTSVVVRDPTKARGSVIDHIATLFLAEASSVFNLVGMMGEMFNLMLFA